MCIRDRDKAIQKVLDDLVDEAGIDLMRSEGVNDPGAQIDKADDLRKKWNVERGQLWYIPSKTANGEHRIICGDCTDSAVVERVMAGEKANAVITDPPYGYGFYETDKSVPVDFWTHLLDWGNTFCIFGYFWVLAPVWISVSKQVKRLEYIAWCPTNYSGVAQGRLVKAHQDVLVYRLDNGIWRADDVRRGAYHRSELAKYKSRTGGRSRFPDWKLHPDGPRFTDVWTDAQPGVMFNAAQRQHPNEKPVAVLSRLVELASNQADVIFDTFLGSGTTLVTCERLGRLGRGIEIEPKYEAVALQRLADMGLEPHLVKPLEVEP